MLEQYHDKQPVAEKLQEFMANKAATDMLLDKNKEALNDDKVLQPKPRKSMRRVILCFVVLYIVTAVLATLLVKLDYAERFDNNLKTVKEHLMSSEMENEVDYVNRIFRLSVAKEDYQSISAAVYDREGKLVAKANPCIRLEDDGEVYIFSLTDYFVIPEIESILLYAKDTAKEYLVEAKVGKESGTLASMQFSTSSLVSGSVTVWEWENTKYDLSNEETVTFRKKTLLTEVIQVPHAELERYEEWRDEAYLHDFTETIRVDEKHTKTRTDGSNAEVLQKIETEDETYWIALRSTMSSTQATLWTLLPVYAVGLVLTAVGIFFTIHEFKKYNKK